MIDEFINTLNYENLIDAKIKQIIDEFVSFYGEERREEIERKINGTVIIPYMSIESLKTTISKIKKLKTEEILKKLEESNLIDSETMKKLFNKVNIEYSSILDYYKYVDRVKETNDREIKPPFSLLSVDKEIDGSRILDGNKTNMMEVMDSIRPHVIKLMEDYDKTIDKIKDKIELSDRLTKKSSELKDKYLLEFASKYKDFLGEEYAKIEKEYYERGKIFINSPRLNLLISRSFSLPTCLDYFDEDNEEIIREDNNRIKQERIKYFKSMGIDLGDDYESYEKDEQCKKIWPSKDFIEKVKEDRKITIKNHNREVYSNYPAYVEIVKKIDQINPLEKMEILDDVIMTGGTGVCPNVSRNENEFISTSFLFINMARGMDPSGLDMAIFHEINHLIELNSLNITEQGHEEICGWDIVSSDYNGESFSDRNYEAFNEIINDMLAEQVARSFHSKGNSIISNPKNARYRVCGYRTTEFLAHDFFIKYYDSIIKSRNGNIKIILDTVGKDNFEELNGLFNEFNENFSGLAANIVHYDKRMGKETENTKKLDEIDKKKNEVLEKMNEFSNNNKMTF